MLPILFKENKLFFKFSGFFLNLFLHKNQKNAIVGNRFQWIENDA